MTLDQRFAIGDCFRETGELVIEIPALPRPTLAEFQEKQHPWNPWIRPIDGIDTSPTEAVTLRLGTVLRSGEDRINGPEFERRCLTLAGRLLGYQHAEWLVRHQDAFPALQALRGKIYIDFAGLAVVGADGSRDFPCLYSDGKRWYLSQRLVVVGQDRRGRLAVSGK